MTVKIEAEGQNIIWECYGKLDVMKKVPFDVRIQWRLDDLKWDGMLPGAIVHTSTSTKEFESIQAALKWIELIYDKRLKAHGQ